MTIKRKDFQKAAALIHEFQLKLSEEGECAELRDALNLALLHMQKYYRSLRARISDKYSNGKSSGNGNHLLSASLRGLSPMTPFRDAPDKFQWRWVNLESPKWSGTLPSDLQHGALTLPLVVQAAKDGDRDLLVELHDKDPRCVHEVDGLGRSALMYAVHFGHLDTMQILLEQEVDLDYTALDGATAVHRACHDGNHEALQILIEYQAHLEIQDLAGRAPIHWACANSNRECLKLLIDNNVNVNVRDKEGLSPAMWACRMDHIEHFELLSGVAVQHVEEEDGFERDINGRTWLHWSARRTEPLECLKTLLTEEAACLADEDGKTVMLTAAENGSVPAIKVILEIAGKSCLEHRDTNNRTPLILAAMGGHGELINFLLAEGADLASVDNFGATAWDYARGCQLHYCMLIIASYIRQRARDEVHSSEEAGSGPENLYGRGMPGMDSDMQFIGANGHQLYAGNKPIPAPHPPSEPPTPRTPRAPVTPRTPRAPVTPRGGGGPTPTPRAPTAPRTELVTPRTPATPRGFAIKRSPPGPMDYDEEEEEEGEIVLERHERESSAGSKRKRADNQIPERELMSVMSIDSYDNVPDSHLSPTHNEVPNQEPQMVHHTQYVDGPGSEQEEPDSVSISAMDVSDMDEADEEKEEEGTSGEQSSGPPQPTPRGTTGRLRYQRGQRPHPHNSGRPHYQSHSQNYGETLQQQIPYQAPRQKSPPSDYPERTGEDEEYEGPYEHETSSPGPPSPQPRPRQGVQSPDNRPIPPAHLTPLPPPSPTHKKKKKKKKDHSRPNSGHSQTGNDLAQPSQPHQPWGYVAPIPPPHTTHAPPHGAPQPLQHPAPSQQQERPMPRQDYPPAERPLSGQSSSSGHGQQQQGLRSASMRPGKKGIMQPPRQEIEQSNHRKKNLLSTRFALDQPKKATTKQQAAPHMASHSEIVKNGSPPRMSPRQGGSSVTRAPPLPQAQPRPKLTRMRAEQRLNGLDDSDSRDEDDDYDDSPGDGPQQRYPAQRSPAPRGKVRKGQGQRLGGLVPNGQVPRDGSSAFSRRQGNFPGGPEYGQGQRKPGLGRPQEQHPPSPRARQRPLNRGTVPPLTKNQMPNGRLPPTY